MLDTTSALLELAHLRLYESNGIGSYVLDAMSAHAEAVADALAAMLLWCLGAGWTLSTELQERALHSTTPIARLYHDWRHPFGHSGSGQALIGPGHVLMMFLVSGHVILAQWGRVYNDNFDSYHDYEHGPGRMLMWLRLTAGALFALGTWHTHQGLQQHAAGKTLSDFYKTLLGCGVVWYAGLPVLIWWVKLLPYYLKNCVVVVGSSVLQACVLASLAYLVTYSKALAKVNASVTNKNHSEDVLPGSLGSTAASAPRLFSLGPAKVRLD
uniref:GPR180/TMEM145 transmembrane domain-containing protein n=1 Tax=Amphora coffeiformis TaxID=265554 RepID=A0A7S3L2B9_9STRA